MTIFCLISVIRLEVSCINSLLSSGPCLLTSLKLKLKWNKVLDNILSLRLELQGVTCHMGSHSVTCHPTQVNMPHLNPGQYASTRFMYPTRAHRDGRLSVTEVMC